MKIHYINILLFALPLNILIYNQRNHYITRTPKATTRTLCECELYAPSNYDNDSQMKEVMENYNRQASERFKEYDERMIQSRQKCKEQCNKEIQKIILKDKLEKELAEKFVTLQTDIQNDAIPTCVCEKSLADKVEKTCLRCGSVFGGGIAPSVGLLGGIGEAALYAWKPKALEVAIKEALKAGATEIAAAAEAAGNARGVEIVIKFLKLWGIEDYCPGIYQSILKISHYSKVKDFASAIIKRHDQICAMSANGGSANDATCTAFDIALGLNNAPGKPLAPPASYAIPQKINGLVGKAKQAADATAEIATANAKAKITTEQTTAINTIFMGKQTTIIASIVAIVVIVLIMIIIYLILRYRRKKKMKKKLQYIKLLEE